MATARFLRHLACALAAVAVLALAVAAAPARAGGYSYQQMAPWRGIAAAGSPYRWQTFTLGKERPVTVVERASRRGGVVSRRLTLRGEWHLSAPAYDGEGTGLAAHAPVLVLSRYDEAPRGLRRVSRFAVIHTDRGRRGDLPVVERFSLPGDFTLDAISPDGSTLFLTHSLNFARGGPRFTLEAYDLRTDSRLPTAAISGNGEIIRGFAVGRTQDASGHRVYTLYTAGKGRRPKWVFVLVLDTVDRTLAKVEFPRLRGIDYPFQLDLRLDASAHHLAVVRRSGHGGQTVAGIDLRKVPSPPPARSRPIGIFSDTLGSSLRGRTIEMLETGDLSLPTALLVFGCIHGDECGGARLQPTEGGCPAPRQHSYVVPNLDPDGSADASRLNGRGVDLNRNFPSEWRPIGTPGDPEYAGPHPFSEPETRLAAHLIRRLRPPVTIWFHQHWGEGSFVRAWGQSVPAARRFAWLAGLGFRLMRWPAGTAPNWQNHRFPGTASFVVELPRGRLPQPTRTRLDEALGRLGQEMEDNHQVAPEG